MDLYKKVEKVINDHVIEHKEEVRKGKELLSKLDLIRFNEHTRTCLLYTSPSPRDATLSRMPSSA